MVSAPGGTAAPAAPFPSGQVTFTGHGWGPGYGMGQWGAFGLAAVDHWSYHQILAHYYSDRAHPVTGASLDARADGQLVTVAIEENDDSAVTVTSPSAFRWVDAAGTTLATIPAHQAGRAVEMSKGGTLTGQWELEVAPSCTATSWRRLATGLMDPTAVPASLQASAPSSQLLTLCRADGRDVTYRGRLEAYDYYGSATGDKHLERTLNVVALEQYLSDVTPGESPSGWGGYGGEAGAPQGEPWGFQELEAQAVAARSYLLYSESAGGWYGYADTCDDSCQWYGDGVEYETPLATLAVRDTAGQYLAQSGRPAPTEYDSSSGGHTEALSYPDGTSIFDAVSDPADAVCLGGAGSLGCNPVHTWVVSIPVPTLERTFPKAGAIESVRVTATDASGRVETIQIVGSKATCSVSGTSFAGDFPPGSLGGDPGGFLSSLFEVTDGPGAGAAPTGPGAPRPAARSTPGLRSPAGWPPGALLRGRLGSKRADDRRRSRDGHP